jgi:hypothetical protein
LPPAATGAEQPKFGTEANGKDGQRVSCPVGSPLTSRRTEICAEQAAGGRPCRPLGRRKPLRRLVDDHRRLYDLLGYYEALSVKRTNGRITWAYPDEDKLVAKMKDKTIDEGPCPKTIHRMIEDLVAAGLIEKRVARRDPELRAMMREWIRLGLMKHDRGPLPNAYRILVQPEDVENHLLQRIYAEPDSSPLRTLGADAPIGPSYIATGKQGRSPRLPQADQPTLFNEPLDNIEQPAEIGAQESRTATTDGQVVPSTGDQLSSDVGTACPSASSERPYRAEFERQEQPTSGDVVVPKIASPSGPTPQEIAASCSLLKSVPKMFQRVPAKYARITSADLVREAVEFWSSQGLPENVLPGKIINTLKTPDLDEFWQDVRGGWHRPWAAPDAGLLPATPEEIAKRVEQQRHENRRIIEP